MLGEKFLGSGGFGMFLATVLKGVSPPTHICTKRLQKEARRHTCHQAHKVFKAVSGPVTIFQTPALSSPCSWL